MDHAFSYQAIAVDCFSGLKSVVDHFPQIRDFESVKSHKTLLFSSLFSRPENHKNGWAMSREPQALKHEPWALSHEP